MSGLAYEQADWPVILLKGARVGLSVIDVPSFAVRWLFCAWNGCGVPRFAV